MESEPMLTPREKPSPSEAQRRIKPKNLHHIGQRAQHTTDSAIPAHQNIAEQSNPPKSVGQLIIQCSGAIADTGSLIRGHPIVCAAMFELRNSWSPPVILLFLLDLMCGIVRSLSCSERQKLLSLLSLNTSTLQCPILLPNSCQLLWFLSHRVEGTHTSQTGPRTGKHALSLSLLFSLSLPSPLSLYLPPPSPLSQPSRAPTHPHPSSFRPLHCLAFYYLDSATAFWIPSCLVCLF